MTLSDMTKVKVVSRNKLPIWLTQQVGQFKAYRIPIPGLERYLDHFQTREIVTGVDYDGVNTNIIT